LNIVPNTGTILPGMPNPGCSLAGKLPVLWWATMTFRDAGHRRVVSVVKTQYHAVASAELPGLLASWRSKGQTGLLFVGTTIQNRNYPAKEPRSLVN